MKKIAFILLAIIFVPLVGIAAPFDYETCNLGWKHVHHEHNEESYQQAWCSAHNGIMEYENRDFTRVDCLTKKHAVEFDFANKWHESIGQALHYGLMTGKKPMVVLILDNPEKQMVYYYRVKKLGKKLSEYLNISGDCPEAMRVPSLSFISPVTCRRRD